MKRVFMATALIAMPLLAELSVDRIDQMVEQIQGKRQSKVKVDFEKVVSPFVTVVHEHNSTKSVIKMMAQQVNFKLSAIINDMAKINGRWVKTGESIQGYRVEKVEENHVVLKKADRTVELFLPNPKNNNLLQISEG